MVAAVSDLAPSTLIAAIEGNAAEFLLELGRAGGGEERAERNIQWIIGGSPIDYHNAVVRADLAADEVDAAIAASQDRLRAHGVPGTWHVGPHGAPGHARRAPAGAWLHA